MLRLNKVEAGNEEISRIGAGSEVGLFCACLMPTKVFTQKVLNLCTQYNMGKFIKSAHHIYGTLLCIYSLTCAHL